MFGINFSEILLILFISLIIFGPKQLPVIASKLGKVFFGIKRFTNHLYNEIYQQSGFNDIKQAKSDLINTYKQIKSNILITDNPIPDKNISRQFGAELLYQPELDFDHQPELF